MVDYILWIVSASFVLYVYYLIAMEFGCPTLFEADQRLHSKIQSSFPTIVNNVDRCSQWLLNVITDNKFGVLVALVLIVLTLSGVVSKTVTVATILIWWIVVVWAMRSKVLSNFTIPTRSVAVLLIAIVLAWGCLKFRKWSLGQYSALQPPTGSGQRVEMPKEQSPPSKPEVTPPVVERERAHVQVEEVSLDVERKGRIAIPFNLWAHVRGRNASNVPTSVNPRIKAAIVVTTPLHSAQEEYVLFNDRHRWSRHQWMKAASSLYAFEPFSWDVSINLIQLDDMPWSSQTFNDLREGKKIVYVFTRTIYGDKYGAVPDDLGCWGFQFDGEHEQFKQETCFMTIDSFIHTKIPISTPPSQQ